MTYIADWARDTPSKAALIIAETGEATTFEEVDRRSNQLAHALRVEGAFVYHNDAEKTKAVQHPMRTHWTTLGDIGYLDGEGYLYLTDRKAFMLISGGVNIYPQAIEDAYITHPKVGDVAVFGVPDADLGGAVKAVVEPAPGIAPTPELAAELLDFGRQKLARHMAPRSIDFIAEMPRLPTGKLYKRHLKDRYWSGEKRI